MEISYDLIIKYLCNNTFSYKQTILNTINFSFPPNILSKLKDYNRYGVKTYDNNNNISFWMSILTLLNSNVIFDDEIALINKFKNDLIDKYSKSKLYFKIDKSEFREQLKILPNINILQYISDILNYTILICDISSDKFYITYNSTFINQTHSIIILNKYDDFWEPIMNNNKKIFNYNDISHILDNITYYNNIKTIQLNNVDININKTKLVKMRINEVIDLCNKLNITLPEKYNKNILINLVLENI
jgi:hypothetical protein